MSEYNFKWFASIDATCPFCRAFIPANTQHECSSTVPAVNRRAESARKREAVKKRKRLGEGQ